MDSFIPVCEPLLSGNEKEYVNQALDSGWISSSGHFIGQFEQLFADFCGSKYAIATTSGTTALHLALAAAGVGKGDEVIIPDFTMIASAFSVVYCGATPVFIDADPETWNVDVNKIEEKISPRTKAIMPVHILGLPCNMNTIRDIADRYDLLIIEDAAEAHGAAIQDKKCGTFGQLACFSFFGNKIATTGEGGMVITDNENLFDRCKYLRNMAFPLHGERNYIHDEIGFNYRMSNLVAAIGAAQVEKIDHYISMRRKHANLYKSQLSNVDEITWQPEPTDYTHAQWMFGISFQQRNESERNTIIEQLRIRGIDSRRLFAPMHQQPCLAKFHSSGHKYPVSDKLSRTGLYLPSGSGLTDEQIVKVCDTLKEVLRAL